MRFARLVLERYGRFENCELAFRPGAPDLHVIYGANEAGKTTAMAAVSDLLYGFGARSPYNFQFDYSLLRVGAVIEEDGHSLVCRRRKATSGTLVDAADQAIDEAVLIGMLRGVTRDGFRTSFSLDQNGLRRGGQAILEAKDDVGQALFAAGSGLTGVAAQLASLGEEADAIWGPRAKASRTFTAAERLFADSSRAVREQSMKPKTWTDARNVLHLAQQDLTTLESQREALLAERRRAERMRRIGPSARRRADLIEAVEARATTIALQPEREDNAVTAMVAVEEAERSKRAAEKLEAEAMGRAAALKADPEILAEAVHIDALVERRGATLKARQDLERLTIERAGGTRLLTRLREEAGAAGAPTKAVIARLRELAQAHATALSAVREIEASEAEFVARRATLEARLVDVRLSEGLPALAAAVDAAVRLGPDVDVRCASALARAEQTEAEAQRALGRLAPWIGDSDALAALPSILPVEIDEARQRLATVHSAIEREQDVAGRLAEELSALALQAEAVTREGAGISTEALAEARQARDAQWGIMRRHLVDGTPVAAAAKQADALEQAIGAADALADQRYTLAEESGRLAELVERRAARSLEVEQARAREDAAAARLDEARADWSRRLREAGLPDLEPARLQAWVGDRQQALVARDAAAAAQRDSETELARRRAALGELRAQLTDEARRGIDEELAPALRQAEELRAEEEAKDRVYREDGAELRQISETLGGQQRRLRLARDQIETVTAEWARAVEEASLDVPIERADVHLATLEELREAVDADAALELRVSGIERDANAFATDVTALADRLGVSTSDDPAARLDLLRDRLLKGRATDSSLEGFQRERERRRAEVEAADAALDAAYAGLRPTMEETGAVDLATLAAAIEASRAARRLQHERDEIERQIIADGDGYALAELIEAWAAVDPDGVAERAEKLDHEIANLNAEISAAATAAGEARRAFEALETAPRAAAAAAAAADAEQARAEMGVQAENYILKRAQFVMLRWAIEQYRERHQDPLLVRASEIFSMLTLGRYSQLKVELNSSAPRLLGVSQDGRSVVDVGAMSEGTADQLFLALRLAAVEQSIAAGVRLPFLADDLFVNFDDARAEAGFRVLAELAQTTQVLFFTHHAHLALIAREVMGANLHSECALE